MGFRGFWYNWPQFSSFFGLILAKASSSSLFPAFSEFEFNFDLNLVVLFFLRMELKYLRDQMMGKYIHGKLKVESPQILWRLVMIPLI